MGKVNSSNESIPTLDSLFEDYYHPNPNICKAACLKMVKYWPEESIQILLSDLDNTDIRIRRRSVNALSLFGERILLRLTSIFIKSQSRITRISCLKILGKTLSSKEFDSYPDEIKNVFDIALLEEDPEIILVIIPLLKYLSNFGFQLLINLSRDENK